MSPKRLHLYAPWTFHPPALQVVKCRVLRADIPHQRLSLSLAPKSSAPIVEDEAPAGTVGEACSLLH